jgi:pimeloyl-ACP methyl ester carboxylesterase
MVWVRLLLFALGVVAKLTGSTAVNLPPRPTNAVSGSGFAARIAAFDLDEREKAVVTEMTRGNVPAFWRRFVDVKVGEAIVSVSPDYVCVGRDDDYLLLPLTPNTAQKIADALGCVLPTRKIVDAIYRAAPLKLAPAPIPPSPAMTTVPIFAQHNETIRVQRAAGMHAHPLGTLVAGHKKDVVITPQLTAKPSSVAIYGWHRLDGTAIQPLYLGHTASWVDYSHGIRLVRRDVVVNGKAASIDAVLADEKLCAQLSDEGPIRTARYGEVRPFFPEKIDELQFDRGVRVVINSPDQVDATKPIRLILYALPAGNSIEQTMGRRLREGDDWHFDIQHIAAQTRWLRAHVHDANLVVAYLECVEKSWVLWRRKYPEHAKHVVEIVDALRQRFAAPKIVLTGHSAGGTFTFAYLDGMERIPDDIERIAFLDSNYAYDSAKAHDAKLSEWLNASAEHRLIVLAYQDYVALLNGKTFVSEQGGTWGRSLAMLRDLGSKYEFARSDVSGLQRHTALEGRIEFLLKENPDQSVLHTRQVEWNGFIHALAVGTEAERSGYAYLGARAYEEWIARE